MTNMRRHAKVTIILGAVSLVVLLPVHLALTDIWHGEGDLTLEWSVVRLGILTVVALQISAMAVLVRALRTGVDGPAL